MRKKRTRFAGLLTRSIGTLTALPQILRAAEGLIGAARQASEARRGRLATFPPRPAHLPSRRDSKRTPSESGSDNLPSCRGSASQQVRDPVRACERASFAMTTRWTLPPSPPNAFRSFRVLPARHERARSSLRAWVYAP